MEDNQPIQQDQLNNPEPPKASGTNPFILLICIVISLAALGVAGFFTIKGLTDNGDSGGNSSNNNGNSSKTADNTEKKTDDNKDENKNKNTIPQGPSSYSEYNTGKIISGDTNNGGIADHVRGKKDSKVVVVEYADFQCPACATMMPRVDSIYEQYKDRVAFVFRNFPISSHANAKSASIAAESAGLQGKFWDMASALYERREDWITISGGGLKKAFLSIYKGLGSDVDAEKFRIDLNDDNIEKKVEFDYKLGYEVDKVKATPSFLINGEMVDISKVATFADYENMIKQMIEQALKKTN